MMDVSMQACLSAGAHVFTASMLACKRYMLMCMYHHVLAYMHTFMYEYLYKCVWTCSNQMVWCFLLV